MQVWNVLNAARWNHRKPKIAKNSLSAHHRKILSGCIFATKARIGNRKKLNSNISSTCPHNMVNFGPLTAETGSLVWGTPANFNGVCVLASLLHRRRSTEVNKTLHDVCRLLDCCIVYTFSGALPSKGILSGAKLTLRPCLALSYIGSVTARH